MFFGLSYLKLAGLGLVAAGVVGLWLYISHLKHENKVLEEQKYALEEQVDEAVRIAEQNANALDEVRAAAERNERLIAESYETRIAVERKKNRILGVIDDATPEEDAPAAPVLERTVRSLYGSDTAGEVHP